MMQIDTTTTDLVAAANTDDTHLILCPAGDHLRAARRWESTCAKCGQAITTGNVGPVTWDAAQGVGNPVLCNHGSYSFQHGCGEWNTPTEVTVDPAGYDDLEDAIADAIAKLDDEVESEQHLAAGSVTERLRRELATAVAERTKGIPYDDIKSGDDLNPGVWSPEERYDDDRDMWVTDGPLEAWDTDPSGSDDDYITVSESGP